MSSTWSSNIKSFDYYYLLAYNSGSSLSAEETLAGKTGNSSDQATIEALTAKTPSELLICSVVSAQLRELEGRLERTIVDHVTAAVKVDMHDFNEASRSDLTNIVTKTVADLGLNHSSSDEFEGFNSKRGVDRQIQNIEDRLAALSHSVVTVKEDMHGTERDLKAEVRLLERKVEVSMHIFRRTRT